MLFHFCRLRLASFFTRAAEKEEEQAFFSFFYSARATKKLAEDSAQEHYSGDTRNAAAFGTCTLIMGVAFSQPLLLFRYSLYIASILPKNCFTLAFLPYSRMSTRKDYSPCRWRKRTRTLPMNIID